MFRYGLFLLLYCSLADCATNPVVGGEDVTLAKNAELTPTSSAAVETGSGNQEVQPDLIEAAPAVPAEAKPTVIESLPAVAPAAPVALARKPPVPLVEVAGSAWANEISRDGKQPVATISQTVSGRRLVLWMKVQGSAAALDQLAASGKLPIRHKWFRETISGIRPEGVLQPVDDIQIPAAHTQWVDKLRQEVRSVGHFDWRTWSAKEKPGRGHWRVTVFYADNTPVLCRTPGGQRPCEYQIEAR